MFSESEHGDILNERARSAELRAWLRPLGLKVDVRPVKHAADKGVDVLAHVSRASGAAQTYAVMIK